MNRYTQSLFISFSIYTILVFGYMWFFVHNKSQKNISEHIVKLSMVEYESKKSSFEPIEKIVQENTPKEQIKETIENKIINQNIPTKPQLSKQEVTPQADSTPKQVVKDEKVLPHNENVAKQSSSDIEAQKDKFIQKIKSAIMRNKRYPAIAQRMEQEDKVQASFSVSANGYPSGISCNGKYECLNGATKDAISRAFPIDVPNEIMSKMPIHITVSLDYNLEAE